MLAPSWHSFIQKCFTSILAIFATSDPPQKVTCQRGSVGRVPESGSGSVGWLVYRGRRVDTLVVCFLGHRNMRRWLNHVHMMKLQLERLLLLKVDVLLTERSEKKAYWLWLRSYPWVQYSGEVLRWTRSEQIIFETFCSILLSASLYIKCVATVHALYFKLHCQHESLQSFYNSSNHKLL